MSAEDKPYINNIFLKNGIIELPSQPMEFLSAVNIHRGVRITSDRWMGNQITNENMNILALERMIEQIKALEGMSFSQHRDSGHPENCKWGVAWKSLQLARKEIESIKNRPWSHGMTPAVSYAHKE